MGTPTTTQLCGINIPTQARQCLETHLGCIERAEDDATAHVWLNRAESLIEGLEASGAFNGSAIEALYVHFDRIAVARRVVLKG
ncbi:hypothetical protein [Pseudomonas quasicaspiana]|uniref:hypothetical protein n=1 Tax=Pseudomonas quasicaspiana TaxID=2829821 RepID=UPI001E638179|nr:hypothetical protein [Pseudomonas quasicaspiana]MCD5969900.1 hypothetical protein [Pseudomonas quasicaspiana]